jgi:glycosyltransferase involved in cell wall biosynthesis
VPEAVGFVPPADLGRYYEAAAVVCVPSRREGSGMTAREALAHGRRVVATRVGGLADLEEDGVTLVTPGDVGALRAAVEAELAAPSAAPAPERFAPERVGEALLRVYEQAQQTPAGGDT